MDALTGVTVDDRAVLIDETLVIADLHIGKAATSGIQLPVGGGERMVQRFEALCQRYTPEAVVIAGDLLHSFDTIPRLAEETIAGLEALTTDIGADLVVTPGNHDTLIETIWSGKLIPEYQTGKTVIAHGHVEPETQADRYVIGHDHPTLDIEGTRYPCLLVGDSVYNGADVIVLPSFNDLVRGVEVTELTASEFLSPMLTSVTELRPVVYDTAADEPLTFPAIGQLRRQST